MLKDEKGREQRLTKEYYTHFYQSEYRINQKLYFLHFDFHRFCKGDKFINLKVLIGRAQNFIQLFG